MLPIAMKPCRIPFYQTLATRLKTVDAIRQKSTTFAARDGGGQTGTQGRGGMTRKNRKMQQVKNQGLDFIAIDFETATGKRTSVCEVGICAVRNGEIIETRSATFASSSPSPKVRTTVPETMHRCTRGSFSAKCAMPAGATLPKLTAATGNCKHIWILCKFASGFKNRS